MHERSVKNVFISVPYLSVEGYKQFRDYKSVLQSSHLDDSCSFHQYANLISAHGAEYENKLVRKTLDKYQYNNLSDTTRRDTSQVILRASKVQRLSDIETSDLDHYRTQWWPSDETCDNHTSSHTADGDVLMVDQACLWILGNGMSLFLM